MNSQIKSLAAVVIVFMLFMSFTTKLKPKKVVFFGDSITQQGVGKNGYITHLKKALDSNQYELTGAGIGNLSKT